MKLMILAVALLFSVQGFAHDSEDYSDEFFEYAQDFFGEPPADNSYGNSGNNGARRATCTVRALGGRTFTVSDRNWVWARNRAMERCQRREERCRLVSCSGPNYHGN